MPPPRVAYTMLQSWHRVPGGTATSAVRLAEALARTGEVDLIGVGCRGTPAAELGTTVPVRRLPLPYPAVYELWHRWRRLPVQLAVGRVDVVHATAPTVPPVAGAPVVVTVHDLFPLDHPELFTRRGVRIMTRGLELARTEAAMVICPSPATAAACVSHGFAEERLRVVPWGSSVVPPPPERVAATLSRLGLGGRRILLAVGTLEPRKNLVTLFQAVARLDRDDVVVAVVGPRGWGDDPLPAVAALGDRVRALGFVSDDVLADLYAGATVLCCPSLREGFGLPVLDAMSVGTPVVVSTDEALTWLSGAGGLHVPATDVGAWTAALRRLLDDDDERKRLGAAARDRAARFTWEAAAAATLDVYREVR